MLAHPRRDTRMCQQHGGYMFQADRVKNDLIIRIDYRLLTIGGGLFFFSLVLSIWVLWVIAFKVEMSRVKKDIYTAVSTSMSDVILRTFNENYQCLLKLDQCMAENNQVKAINKDIAKQLKN